MKFALYSLCIAVMISQVSCLYDADTKVVILTKDNFKTLVLDSKEPWLVEFYAPWCGHCKALAPEYNKAAKALNGIVNLGALDMDAHREVGTPYNVSSYPTVKYFGQDKSEPVDYTGERKKNDIIDFMLDKARQLAIDRLTESSDDSETAAPKLDTIPQLTGESVFKQKCESQCVIVFLPHLSESSKADRAAQLAVIAKTSSKVNLLWAQGGDYEDLEAELGVLGEGYPQAVGLNFVTKKYVTFKNSLTVENLNEFVKTVQRNQGNTLAQLPKLHSIGAYKHDDL